MAKQPVTVTLTEPVERGSERISQLVVQPPRAKHLRSLKEDMELGDLLEMAEHLTGQPREVIDELDAEDAVRLTEAVGSFFESILPEDSKT